MELKDVFAALEKVENCAEMIVAIKAETNRLSNEAKAHRMNGEKASGKDMFYKKKSSTSITKNKCYKQVFSMPYGNNLIKEVFKKRGTRDGTEIRLRYRYYFCWLGYY